MDVSLDNQLLDKRQNLTFHIKTATFPIDKKEFIMCTTNYKADYADNFGDLMAFHNNSIYRKDIPNDGCRTHINDNIWNYVFYRKYDTKHKETKTTFMYDVMKCKTFNKSQCYNRIRKEISKDIVKVLNI